MVQASGTRSGTSATDSPSSEVYRYVPNGNPVWTPMNSASQPMPPAVNSRASGGPAEPAKEPTCASAAAQSRTTLTTVTASEPVPEVRGYAICTTTPAAVSPQGRPGVDGATDGDESTPGVAE